MSRARYTAAFRELSPFAATALAGWAAVTVGTHMNWTEYGVSVAMLVSSWTLGLTAGFHGHSRSWTVLGSIGFIGAVALLRQAAGGADAGIASLTLLPVLQTALHVRSRGGLLAVLGSLVPFYFTPLLFIGPPLYPHSGYRGAALSIAAASIIGLVTQSLVTDIRRRAHDTRQREKMLVRINAAMQRLLDGPQNRGAVCASIADVSEAYAALLVERQPGTEHLRYTAASPDLELALSDVEVADAEIVRRALSSEDPIIVTTASDADIANFEFFSELPEPRTVLFKPLFSKGNTVGVVIAAWAGILPTDDARISVAKLMARQMVTVIERADVIDQLTGEALTDPLTGLPNRRAWNARLAAALAVHQQVAVAMFDIDHFKDYNDSFGHPAGDSLLERTATAWRDQLRRGDFLARLGGEEFGLLLPGADRITAERVVERVRNSVPDGETCSAGIALRVDADGADQLVGRADRALYEAKAAGRDRTVVLIAHELECAERERAERERAEREQAAREQAAREQAPQSRG